MSDFKPEANLNTLIEISGAGKGSGMGSRGLKMEIWKQPCVPLQRSHPNLEPTRRSVSKLTEV